MGQNVATLDCIVRSSYPQLHGIVNLIKIVQGGLETFALRGTLVKEMKKLMCRELEERKGLICMILKEMRGMKGMMCRVLEQMKYMMGLMCRMIDEMKGLICKMM